MPEPPPEEQEEKQRKQRRSASIDELKRKDGYRTEREVAKMLHIAVYELRDLARECDIYPVPIGWIVSTSDVDYGPTDEPLFSPDDIESLELKWKEQYLDHTS